MKNDRSLGSLSYHRGALPAAADADVFHLQLLRGHNAPGGGFVGGLLAAAAFVLYGIARGMDRARRLLRTEPQQLILLGLIMALVSAILPMFIGGTLLEAIWLEITLPAVGKLGTPLLFDLGVYLTVLGITMLIVLSLASLRETG